jgi:hypothetical protein
MSGHIEAFQPIESGAEAADNGGPPHAWHTLRNTTLRPNSASMDKRQVALNIADAFRLLSDAPSAFAGCKNCRAAYYQHGPNSVSTRFKPCDHFADSNEEHAKAVRESDEWVLNKIVSLL